MPSQSEANISQQLWTICWNTHTPLSLAVYLSGQKIFRTDIARKGNTNVYVSHTHFSWNSDYSEVIKIMCMISNSVSWEPLYLIYQVLYQSSGTSWSYRRCMKIASLIEVALYVIVYMQFFFGHTFSLFTKELQDLAVMNRKSRGSNWASLEMLYCVYVFHVFLDFTGLLRGNEVGINSNSWSWRPNNL